MKISSPKDERRNNGSNEPNFLHLSTMNNESTIPREKLGNWQTEMNRYATEVFSTTKIFSPVVTPRKTRKGLVGESVWRTPNSKQLASTEKHFEHMGTPDYKYYN